MKAAPGITVTAAWVNPGMLPTNGVSAHYRQVDKTSGAALVEGNAGGTGFNGQDAATGPGKHSARKIGNHGVYHCTRLLVGLSNRRKDARCETCPRRYDPGVGFDAGVWHEATMAALTLFGVHCGCSWLC